MKKRQNKNVKYSSSSRRGISNNNGCDASRPFVVVGLGNPGIEFENTRHNIGFLAVDRIASTLGISLEGNRKWHVRIGDSLVEGKRVFLVEPQTFMNQSGSAVRTVLANVRAPHENVVLIYDDTRLPLGSIRMSTESGAGGQKGVKDVLQCLGNRSKLVRMRVGVGAPASRKDLADFVLENFSEEDRPALEDALEKVEKEVMVCLMRVDANQTQEEEEEGRKEKEGSRKEDKRARSL